MSKKYYKSNAGDLFVFHGITSIKDTEDLVIAHWGLDIAEITEQQFLDRQQNNTAIDVSTSDYTQVEENRLDFKVD